MLSNPIIGLPDLTHESFLPAVRRQSWRLARDTISVQKHSIRQFKLSEYDLRATRGMLAGCLGEKCFEKLTSLYV